MIKEDAKQAYFASAEIWRSMTMLLNIIVLSSGYIKFIVDVAMCLMDRLGM